MIPALKDLKFKARLSYRKGWRPESLVDTAGLRSEFQDSETLSQRSSKTKTKNNKKNILSSFL